jgi:D-alanyl-D-alanine carboxypeptidase
MPALGTNRRRLLATIGIALCVVTFLAGCGTSGQATAGRTSLTATFAAIEGAPRYAHSTWGYEVTDVKSGNVLAAQNAQKMFDPGSTMKL